MFYFVSLCHSFVLDPQDITYEIEGIFTKAELEEISAHRKCNLPDMPEDLLNYLMTFAKVFKCTYEST